MSALDFIVILLVLWAIKEFIVGIFTWRRTRQLRHKLRVERTLHHFAEVRNQLTQLALERKIDAHSQTFQQLYTINTYIMRRPDAYPQISSMLQYLIMNREAERSDSLSAESKNWSPEMKEVVKASADALGYLILNYSFFARLIYRLEKWINPSTAPRHILRVLSPEKDPVVKEIRQTQKEMYRLCAI
jgi:hypothetical protein